MVIVEIQGAIERANSKAAAREKLWCDVFVGLAVDKAQEGVTAMVWADNAVNAFDRKFSKARERHDD